jgi:hypothetical protein
MELKPFLKTFGETVSLIFYKWIEEVEPAQYRLFPVLGGASCMKLFPKYLFAITLDKTIRGVILKALPKGS